MEHQKILNLLNEADKSRPENGTLEIINQTEITMRGIKLSIT